MSGLPVTGLAPTVVYVLCMLASMTCAGLLARAWRASRSRLLLWTAISFGFLALNNLLLVADLVIFAQVNLLPYRQASAGLAIATLLYGFIWEVDE
ncbi:DUF5985 family protein [Caulobacter rhizosphaerae]|jgi:hypothetical protein|uniref:CHASE2 domain-containing sensor protein n=1 Tax=Caulobacter rhizosphaerae TaxID=2010972 RepID=A0ABU1N6J4_9CAUL|nr:DUF5985 family protein [Caulobacter rhizosphaerae]MDR6534044.1 CHASE2 domain-containing sensor protein [Caulobacter rhizosphaerae]GGL45536.1 hypothetical protein GCM10010983_48470 [Caulobacter rhizosphaerae]